MNSQIPQEHSLQTRLGICYKDSDAQQSPAPYLHLLQMFTIFSQHSLPSKSVNNKGYKRTYIYFTTLQIYCQDVSKKGVERRLPVGNIHKLRTKGEEECPWIETTSTSATLAFVLLVFYRCISYTQFYILYVKSGCLALLLLLCCFAVSSC